LNNKGKLEMTYVYLLDLYKFIEQSLAEAKDSAENSENDLDKIRFHEGRIEILMKFKSFLIERLNPKLPRKIREDLC
jgi:hypothetical protein